MSFPEIQMLWVRGPLSTLERLSIVSHLKNGHPVRLFSYDRTPDLPEGAVWEDARAILPESEVFTNPAPVGKGGLTVFSNFFRYHLILLRGGIWSDCDSVCLKPLAFAADMENFFGTERLAQAPDGKPKARVNSGVFKAPAGSPVMARALEIAKSVDLAKAPWGSTGPAALHQAVIDTGLAKAMLAPAIFYPVNWWDIRELVAPDIRLLPDAAHAVHFWNEMWRRNFLDKDASYDPLSLYERLKRHYLDD